MPQLANKLKGGDLRSIGNANAILPEITNQQKFDELFSGLFNADRLVVMRSADAIEKITISHPEYLKSHKKELLELLYTATHIELKWHLAQLMPRLMQQINISEDKMGKVWDKLSQQALDKTERSRIVRVLSLQALFDIQKQYPELKKDFIDTMEKMDRENIPSIKARIRILRKAK
jgi:hypothetical protein